MDNYTTAETAWKLKEKGFPQPAMNDDQIWYDTIGVSFKSNKFSNLNLKHWAYAPTPADILKELGKDYNLSFFEGLFYCVWDNLMGEAYSNENPAEACALAFMDN